MAIIGVASVRIKPDLSEFRKELNAGLKAIKAEVEVNVQANISKAKAQIEEFVRKESGQTIKKKVELDKNSLKSVAGGLASLGAGAAKISAVALAFVAITAAAQSLGPLLVQAAASALLIPGALAVVVAGFAAVKLGAEGAKRAFATLKPTIDALKTSVSASFERALIPAMNNLKTILPALTRGLQGVATAVGGAATKFTIMLKSTENISKLNQILVTSARVIQNIGAALAPIGQAFINVANIAGPFLLSLTSGFASAAQRVAEFTGSAEGIVKIQGWIRGALDAFRTLGQIVTQVVGIFAALFSGLSAGAGNLGSGLLPVLTAINKALSDGAGRAALEALGRAFSALGQSIAGTIGPAITAALPTLTRFFNFVADHAETFGPLLVAFGAIALVVGKLGPLFSVLTSIIGPLFTLIRANPIILLVAGLVGALAASGQLTPILQMIGSVIQRLATAIMPILNKVFDAFVKAITPIIDAVLPVLGQLFDALVPVITQLAGVIGDGLVTVLQALAGPAKTLIDAILPVIVDLIKQLAPVISDIIKAFGELIVALAPVIGLLAGLIATILPPLISLIVAIIVPIVKFAGVLITLVVKAITAVIDAIVAVIDWFKNLGSNASSIGDKIGSFFSTIGQFFANIGSKIAEAGGAILDFFKGLPAKIGTFLASLPGIIGNALLTALKFGLNAVVQGIEWILAEFIALPVQIVVGLFKLGELIGQAFIAAFDFLKTNIPIWIGNVVDFFAELPGKIYNAIVSLLETIGTFFKDLWDRAIQFTAQKIVELINWARGLPDRLMAAINSLLSSLGNFFRDTWNRAVQAVRDGAGAVVEFVKSLPSKIIGALGDFGNMLFNAGKNIIMGLINGIKSAAGAVVGAVGDVLAKARSLLPFSPAKRGPFSGKGWTLYSGMSISQALADGITASGKYAVQATEKLMAQVAGVQVPDLAGDLAAMNSGLSSSLSSNLSASVDATANLTQTPIVINVVGDENGLKQFVDVQVGENNRGIVRRTLAGTGAVSP